MKTKLSCAQCRQELDLGVDAIQVVEGVIGMKGFVPLGETLSFCCEKCVAEYYDLGNLPSLPRRIP